MRTGGISPIKHTHKAQTQNGSAQRKDAGSGASGEGGSGAQRQDAFVRGAQAPADMQSLLRHVEKNNETIREAVQQAQHPQEGQAEMVPSVVGLQLRTAIVKLQRAGLRVDSITQERSLRVPKGRVASQLPYPGSAMPENTGMRLVINSGD